MSCDGTASGRANINLLATPFRVADSTCSNTGLGTAVFSYGDQVVDITGGGNCGWRMPCVAIYNPYNNRGGWVLDLEYVGGL